MADQNLYVQKIVELLLDRRQTLSFGEFPMAFTDTHDLSLDYLVNELIFYLKQDVAAIQQCIEELRMDLPARTWRKKFWATRWGICNHWTNCKSNLPARRKEINSRLTIICQKAQGRPSLGFLVA